ncbi:MAG: twin-arginine translocase TatA/TatE family subunit [Bacteroides sp.]|nr:twin-arginine translocase TatA/TatE family subunit [Bacteroides sp.]MCM1422081.1 twin-arginine translocase TatA/TatE family subunit [Bacteroides sp.]
MMIPMFFGLGMPEVIVIMLVVLLLFGGKKVPELMKGLGKGMRSFKEGMNGIDTDDVDKQKTPDGTIGNKQEQGLSEESK